MLIVRVIILSVLLVNTLISATPFEANPNSLEISNVNMIRDLSYNGEDPNRDWNTTIKLTIESKNLFFKPIGDDMLVFNKNGNLSLQTNWTFSIFNIFDTYRFVKADQSVLIDENISNEDITLKLYGDSNNLIPFEISNINN